MTILGGGTYYLFHFAVGAVLIHVVANNAEKNGDDMNVLATISILVFWPILLPIAVILVVAAKIASQMKG